MKNRIHLDKLFNYMVTHNMSKTKRAKQCKISLATLNKILSEKEAVQFSTVFKIAKGLDIPIFGLYY